MSYVIFVVMSSSIFHLNYPQISAYIFVEFLLILQFFAYLLSRISWQKVANTYVLAERERSVIRVLESVRRISNVSIVKNTIIEEINTNLNPDKCFIVLYNPQDNSFSYDEYLEFLPSNTLLSPKNLDEEILEFKQFVETFNTIEINFSNVNDYIEKFSLSGTSKENLLKNLNVKSLYSIPINYNNNLLGFLILQYRTEYKEFNKEDFLYLQKMAYELAILINKETEEGN